MRLIITSLLLGACLGGKVQDADGDGFGVEADCDDSSSEINPGEKEACDGYDNNCDGAVDEGTTGMRTWYYDEDGDLFGEDELTVTACEGPPGYVLDAGDCEPLDGEVHPGHREICENGKDDDCDPSTNPCGVAQVGGVGDAPSSLIAAAGGGAFATSAAFVSHGEGPAWLYLADPSWDGDGGVWGVNEGQLSGVLSDLSVDRLTVHLSSTRVGAEVGAAMAPAATAAGGTTLAVGAPGASLQEDGEGLVVLLQDLAARGDLESAAGATITGAGPGRRLGAALVDLGDVDGDGVPDLAVGAPGDVGGAGGVGVFRGPVQGQQELGDAATWLRGDPEHAPLGEGLAAGDLDGDGLGDLLLSGPTLAGGAVWVAFGPLDTGVQLVSDLPVRVDAEQAGDELGTAMATGDLDGDGVDDLVISAPGAWDEAGAVYLLQGGEVVHARAGRLVATQARARLDGATAGDRAGMRLDASGDLDGDGRRDLVVGAPGVLRSGGQRQAGLKPQREVGAVYVITSNASGNRSLSVSDGTIRGEPDAGVGGPGVALILPDVDGNEVDELLIGGPTLGPGKAWIFLPLAQ